MIALYIILGVLLLLFLILMIRVQVFASFSEEPTVRLKILFWNKMLIPAPEKPKKEKKPKPKKKPKKQPEQQETKPEEKKQSYLGKIREKKGLSGVVTLLTSLARIAGGTLKRLFSHVVIHRLDVGIALNTGDAASTAITYGKLCSVVYPAVNVIVSATVCKDYHVTIEPVFDREGDTEIAAELHAHLRLIFALAEGVKAGVRLLLLRWKL